MTLSTIAEEASSKDDDYVQTVSIDSPEPQMLPCQRTFGNPAILGLISLGTIFLYFSIVTLASESISPHSMVVVIATFYGGILQIIVGVWEMFLGNTFSATVFATYGSFIFSYGALCLPRIGHMDNGAVQQFYNAIGIYLVIWSSIIFLLLWVRDILHEYTSNNIHRLGSLRTNISFITMHASTVCALICLSLNAFTGTPYLTIAGGILGIVASFSAYYSAFSFFWTQHTSFSLSFIRLPLMIPPFNV